MTAASHPKACVSDRRLRLLAQSRVERAGIRSALEHGGWAECRHGYPRSSREPDHRGRTVRPRDAPARVWREWCSRFTSDVGADHLGSSWARVHRHGMAGHARDHRSHRRDRPARHVHRRRRLPAVRQCRRLGPGRARRPARRPGHARRAGPWRRRSQADPPAQGRRPQEGARAKGTSHRHRRARRRGGARRASASATSP